MFKTRFNYENMEPRHREMLEALAARIGEDKAARAYEVAVLAEEMFFVMKFAHLCDHHSFELFEHLMRALFYSGPHPDLDDVTAVRKLMEAANENRR